MELNRKRDRRSFDVFLPLALPYAGPMQTCVMCGKDGGDEVKFCSRCGTPTAKSIAAGNLGPKRAHPKTTVDPPAPDDTTQLVVTAGAGALDDQTRRVEVTGLIEAAAAEVKAEAEARKKLQTQMQYVAPVAPKQKLKTQMQYGEDPVTTIGSYPIPELANRPPDPAPVQQQAAPMARKAFAATMALPGAPPMQPPIQAQPMPAPNPNPVQHARTSLGFDAANAGLAAQPQPHAQRSAFPAQAQRIAVPNAKATMIGAAASPVVYPRPAENPQQAPVSMNPGRVQVPNAMPTMLGAVVAPHGQGSAPIANRNTGGMTLPPIVPAPSVPLPVPLPPKPIVVEKASGSGLSLSLVITILGLLVLIGGVVAALLLLKRAPIVSARASLDDAGHDVISLRCESCKDGTRVSLGTAAGVFAKAACALVLDAPLSLGNNALTLHLDRAGSGRDEDVKLLVPVSYRMKVDALGLEAASPMFKVIVETAPGVVLLLDGKKVEAGVSEVPILLGTPSEGVSESVVPFEKSIAYEVTAAGEKSVFKGALLLKARILPLRVESPRPKEWVLDGNVVVSGQVAPGSRLLVQGVAATVDAQGNFNASVAVPTSQKLTLVTMRKDAASRSADLELRAVPAAELAKERKDFEASTSLGFDDLSKDIAAQLGKPIVLDGEVVEVRSSPRSSVVLVDIKKGCARNCLSRIVASTKTTATVTKGDAVRIYGHVARAAPGASVQTPEIDAVYMSKKRP
jgi:hypothetical protein